MSWLKTLKPVFFVRSLEPFYCPCCHSSERKVIGSRNRKVFECHEDVQLKVFRIRRLQCRTCRRIHHELPDRIVPYKRHEAKSIEAVMEDDPMLSIPADESTTRRWKVWFDGISCHLLGVLSSLDKMMETTPFSGTALQRIRRYVGDAPGWLSRAVQSVVKKNAWVQTRSAFSAG